ncbi:hypothetical protein EB001_23160, partial [bacterium]|nr:hypothetical protein [bacterium]
KNYFTVSIPDLDLNTAYDIQFVWIYADKTLSDPSAKVRITTANEGQLLKPKFLSTDLTSNSNSLIVKWSGLDYLGNSYPTNFDHVEIWIKGGIFGNSYVLYGESFRAAGTKTIITQTGTYYVKLRAVSKLKNYSDFSDEQTVFTLSPLTVDNIGPDNVTTVTTSGGIDPNGAIGFNGYAIISWNSVSDSTLRGYRIRYKATGDSIYSYADSPGTGTSYKLGGLGVGLTYQIAVATYDELNNTSSSYVSGANVSISGTPFIANTVNVTGYFNATSGNDVDAFKFGYGVSTGKRGLVFNSSNYWYIDSNSTASLNVGGSTSNYLNWDGSAFKIDGNLIARQGTFNGNVSIASGGSLYSGTLTGETVTSGSKTGGTLTGTGFILNSSGLEFRYNGTIKTQITASTGTIYAEGGKFLGEIFASSFSTAAENSSSARIQITTTDANRIRFYNSSNQLAWISQESDHLYIVSGDSTPFPNMANIRLYKGGNLYLSGALRTDTVQDLGTGVQRLRTIEVTTQSTTDGGDASGSTVLPGGIRLVVSTL